MVFNNALKIQRRKDMPKLKHLKDIQWTKNIVCNHQEKLWDKSHHLQNNSRSINRECIVILYRREYYQLRWKNVLMTRMHITLEISLIILSKWLKSTLKRNQFMNEFFVKSFINDIDWRNIKEENSWSLYHKRLMMVQESFIIIQDMIWRIESIKRILTLRKISHVSTNIILVIQSKENILI